METNGETQPALEVGPDADTSVLGAAAADPIQEVRQLKRWCQIGIYGALFAVVLPIMIFLLRLNVLQWVVCLAMGIIVPLIATELTFRQVFRMRKRSAYPGLLIFGLAEARAPATNHQALGFIIKLLGPRAGFLALRNKETGVSITAVIGLDRRHAERLLRACAVNVHHAMQTGRTVPFPFNRNHPALVDFVLEPDESLVFVPAIGLQGAIGVLGLIGSNSNEDLKDAPLLKDIGFALGLYLDNLQQKEELIQLAAVDHLTLVYNRRYFFEQVEREMTEARRYNGQIAILLLDVDGLKRLNDSFGHRAGDQALRAVAQRLVLSSRGADVAARLGGDEFALILPRTGRQGAQDLAIRLVESVAAQPLDFGDGHLIELAISCGVAAFPDDGDNIEALIQAADASMYAAKQAKRAKRKVKTR